MATIPCFGQANIVVRVEYNKGIAVVFALATRSEIVKIVAAVSGAICTGGLDNYLLAVDLTVLQILRQPFVLGIIDGDICQIVDLPSSSIEVESSFVALSIEESTIDADVRICWVNESPPNSNSVIHIVGTANHISLDDCRVSV